MHTKQGSSVVDPIYSKIEIRSGLWTGIYGDHILAMPITLAFTTDNSSIE